MKDHIQLFYMDVITHTERHTKLTCEGEAWVSFVSSKSDQIFTFENAGSCATTCYIVPRCLQTLSHYRQGGWQIARAVESLVICLRAQFWSLYFQYFLTEPRKGWIFVTAPNCVSKMCLLVELYIVCALILSNRFFSILISTCCRFYYASYLTLSRVVVNVIGNEVFSGSFDTWYTCTFFLNFLNNERISIALTFLFTLSKSKFVLMF